MRNPPPVRVIVRLHYFRGRTVDTIVRKTGRSAQHVYHCLRRARATMRAGLTDAGVAAA